MAELHKIESPISEKQLGTPLGKKLLTDWYTACFPNERQEAISMAGQEALVKKLEEKILEMEKEMKNDPAKKNGDEVALTRSFLRMLKKEDPSFLMSAYVNQLASEKMSVVENAYQNAQQLPDAARILKEGVVLTALADEINMAYRHGNLSGRTYISYVASMQAAKKIREDLYTNTAQHGQLRIQALISEMNKALHIPITDAVREEFRLPKKENPQEFTPAGEWHELLLKGALLPVRVAVTPDLRVRYSAAYRPRSGKGGEVHVSVSPGILQYTHPGTHTLYMKITELHHEVVNGVDVYNVTAAPHKPELTGNAAQIIKPLEFVRAAADENYFTLPFGARMKVNVRDLPKINPVTGNLYALDGVTDTGITPFLKLTKQISETEYEGDVEPISYAENRTQLDAVVRQYIFGSRARRQLPQQDIEFINQIERLGFLSGETAVPSEIARRLRKIMDRETQKEPQYAVVSARMQVMRKGFDAIIPWLEGFGSKNPNAQAQTKELVEAARKARAAMEARTEATMTVEEYTKSYTHFFELLYAFENSKVAQSVGKARHLRSSFFASDLDGESANLLLNTVGIHTLVIPQVPNMAPENVENVRGAVYMDASHQTGSSTTKKEDRFIIFLDENVKAHTYSATHATEKHLRDLGFLSVDPSELGVMRYVISFINAVDTFAGPYATQGEIKKIFENSHKNIYGLAQAFAENGRADLVLRWFQAELPTILRKAKEQEVADQQAGIPQRQTLEDRVLRLLTDYDAGVLFEKRLSPESQLRELIRTLHKTYERSVNGIKKLEDGGYVIHTDFGRTLVDVKEEVTFSNGKKIYREQVPGKALAAFGSGYDAYVAYNPSAKMGMVNIRPGLSKTLPADMALDPVTKQPKGALVKEGRYFAMNAMSPKLTGIGEFFDALFRDLPRQLSAPLQALVEKEGGSAIPPLPDPEFFQKQRTEEKELQEFFKSLRPELLGDRLRIARMIVAAHEGDYKLRQVLQRELNAEKKDHAYIERIERVFLNWLHALSPDQKRAYVVKAAEAVAQHEAAEKNSDDHVEKWMNARLRNLTPEKRALLARALRLHAEIPDDIQTAEEKELWRRFVTTRWYPSLTLKQKILLEEPLERAAHIKKREAEIDAQIAHAEAEQKALKSRRFGLSSRAEHMRREQEEERLLQLLNQLKLKKQEVGVESLLEQHTKFIDNQLESIVKRHGRAVESVDVAKFGEINNGTRVGNMTVDGGALIYLYGTPNEKTQWKTSPLLNAASRMSEIVRTYFANKTANVQPRVRTHFTEEHMPSVLGEAISLQDKITEVWIDQLTKKPDSLAAARTQEPLKRLYEQYDAALKGAAVEASKVYEATLSNLIQLQDEFLQVWNEKKTGIVYRTLESVLADLTGEEDRLKKLEAQKNRLGQMTDLARAQALAKPSMPVSEKKGKKKKGAGAQPTVKTDYVTKDLLREIEYQENVVAVVRAYQKYLDAEVRAEQTLGTHSVRPLLTVMRRRLELTKKLAHEQTDEARADIEQQRVTLVEKDPETEQTGAEFARQFLRTTAFLDQAYDRIESELSWVPHTADVAMADLFTQNQKTAIGNMLSGLFTREQARVLEKPVLFLRDEAVDFGKEEARYVAKPFDTPLHAVISLLRDVHPQLHEIEVQQLAVQFLGTGEVKDSVLGSTKHFLKDGVMTTTLFAGDELIARKAQKVPFGFVIEIHHGRALRGPATEHEVTYDKDGKLEYYYERESPNIIAVWKYLTDDTSVRQRIGSFDNKNVFTPEVEHAFEYQKKNGGGVGLAPQSSPDIFFTLRGEVVQRTNDQMNKVGTIKLFDHDLRTIRVDAGNGEVVQVDKQLNGYFVDPRGVVWFDDPLLKMTAVGTITLQASETENKLSLVQHLQESA